MDSGLFALDSEDTLFERAHSVSWTALDIWIPHMSPSARLVASFVFALLSTLSSAGSAAITINGYTPETNDRFTNDPAFIMSGFDLSGIGQAASGRWATAISRNVIVSAAHFAPSGTVSFFEANDAASGAITRSVATGSGTRVPGTDLWVGVLDSQLPSSITHYEYATEALSGVEGSVTNAGIYQGLNAYLVGRSPETHPANQDQAFGRNRVTGFQENVDAPPPISVPDLDALLFDNDPEGSAPFVEFESRLVSGDSGAPTFVEIGGSFRLIGTNSFIYDGSPNGSGVNYIGNQADFITSFIEANAVPEPGAGVVVCLMAGIVLRRKRFA